MPSRKTGFLITLEGVEGSGKSTQISLLADLIRKRGRQVTLTREPGGTPLADRIRATLLDLKNKTLTPFAELLLYEIARRDHVETVIRPALARGNVVLCDRFTDATLAYQGFARGLSLSMIRTLNTIAAGGIVPHLTFLFDLPVREGLRRTRSRKRQPDRLDKEKQSFHERVRRGYLTLARRERRFVIIDASRDRKIVFEQLCHAVEKRLFKNKASAARLSSQRTTGSR